MVTTLGTLGVNITGEKLSTAPGMRVVGQDRIPACNVKMNPSS